MFWRQVDSDSDSEPEDVEATERERAEQVRLGQARLAEQSARRRRAEADEELRRYGARRARVEEPSLAELMQRKALPMHPEERKREFLDGITDVVDYFELPPDDFRETMKEVKVEAHLIRLIEQRHGAHGAAAASEEQTASLYAWFAKFYKETVSVLHEMSSIPDGTVLNSIVLSDPFQVTREACERRLALEIDQHALLAAQLLREAEYAAMLAETEDLMLTLSADFGDVARMSAEGVQQLNRELAERATDARRNALEPRSSSPPRVAPLSRRAHEQLLAAFHHLTVEPSRREEMLERDDEDEDEYEEEDDEEDDENPFGWMFATVAEEPVATSSTSSSCCTLTPSPEGVNFNINDVIMSSDVEIDDEEFCGDASHAVEMLIATEKAMPKPNHFGYEEQLDEYRKEMDANLYRPKRERRVRFADFTDERNTMRIFVQNNAYYTGDDGYPTMQVQLQLAAGWRALWSTDEVVAQPFIARLERSLGFSAVSCQPLQRVTVEIREDSWMADARGHQLARFWFDRDQLKTHRRERLNRGLALQYTPMELAQCYRYEHLDLEESMQRSTARHVKPQIRVKLEQGEKPMRLQDERYSKVRGVLILTDWRLIHIDKTVFTNAHFKLLPTNLGRVFFQSLGVYLYQLLRTPNIEIHTIVFAFGGSPTWRKADFRAFLLQLQVAALRSVNVFWLAQDWNDATPYNAGAEARLRDWNSFVRQSFDAFQKSGNDNYTWANIRELYKVRPLPPDATDTLSLETLYMKYVEYMIEHCNCYGCSAFFAHVERQFDEHPASEGHVPCHGQEFLIRENDAATVTAINSQFNR